MHSFLNVKKPRCHIQNVTEKTRCFVIIGYRKIEKKALMDEFTSLAVQRLPPEICRPPPECKTGKKQAHCVYLWVVYTTENKKDCAICSYYQSWHSIFAESIFGI